LRAYRSAASPVISGPVIAEAWQKRRYPANFISKLTDSDGEQAETQHWIGTSLACEYISRAEHDGLLEKCLSRCEQKETAVSAKGDSL
jgi:four helix bundle protein